MTDYERELMESVQRRLGRIELQQGQIYKALITIWKQGSRIMAKIDDLLTALTDEGTKIDNLKAAVTAGTVDPAKVDAALTIVQANNAKIDALVAGLTPPPPPAP